MTTKTSFIKTMITTLFVLQLSACDFTSELFGDDDDDEVQDKEPNYLTVSGKTADGYLVNATVCADLNNNSVCDDGEPSGTTTAGGQYTLDNITDDTNLGNTRIIIEAIAGVTIDEDFPDNPIEKSFTLTSPPGRPAFISPITTVIDTVLQNNEDLTEQEAEEQVKQNLGLAGNANVSLFNDYVEASNDESSEQSDDYKKLHVVAQVVTKVVSESLSSASNSDPTLTSSDNLANTLNAVVTNVGQQLQQINTTVADAIQAARASGEDINVAQVVLASEAVQYVAQSATLNAEQIVKKAQQIQEEKAATSSDIETLLTQQEGFFFINSHDQLQWNGEQCTVNYEFEYDQFKIVEGLGQQRYWYFDSSSSSFIEETEEEEDYKFYSLTESGWTLTEETTPQVQSFSDDGQTLTVSFPGQGSRSIVAKQIDLLDKELSSIERIDEAWAMQMMDSQLFPAEATMYRLSMEQLEDAFIVPFYNCEYQDETGAVVSENCNSIWFTYMPESSAGTTESENDYKATTFESLINKDWDGSYDSLILFHAPMQREYEMALIEESDGTTTTRYALLFERDWSCYEGQTDAAGNPVECESLIVKDELSWSFEEQQGQQLLKIDFLSFEDDDEFSELFLAELEGYVRVGLMVEAGRMWRDEYALNETAMDAVLLGFSAPEGAMIVPKQECGVYDDKDDGSGDGSEEQGPPPVLVSDATTTAQLSGKTYVMTHTSTEGEFETVFLQFSTDNKFEVVGFEEYTETNSDGIVDDYKEEFMFDGTWVVNADKKLLLTYEETSWYDGTEEVKSAWLLLQINGDIGASLSVTDETPYEGEEPETLMFELLEPVALESTLTLTRQEDGQTCEIVMNFSGTTAQPGGGFVDGSNCPNMVADGMSMFDFTWEVGDLGQLILTVYGDVNVENNFVELYENGSGDVFLVIEGDEIEQNADGTTSTYHFANVEQWQRVTTN